MNTIYQPFTYLITFLPTGQRYYGVRTKKNCSPDELWTVYFTSSKIIKQLIAEHGVESFSFEIRKTFSTKEQAILWEHRVLRRLNAAHHLNYLNKNNGDRKLINNSGITMNGKKHTADARLRMSINSSGEKNPMYGKQRSEESRKKMSISSTGKKHTAEARAKMSKAQSGKNNANYGKKFHWWNNGVQNSLVEHCPGEEWVRGRIWSEGHRAKMEVSRWKKEAPKA